MKILRTCSLLIILTCLFNPRDFSIYLLSLKYPAWHLNLAPRLAYYLPNYPPLIYALCYVINYQLFSDYCSLHNNHYRIPLKWDRLTHQVFLSVISSHLVRVYGMRSAHSSSSNVTRLNITRPKYLEFNILCLI